ncbi:Hpt domain-containing protein [Lysobacter sp. H21R4]|uniref:Hpt domain-containing protein n=1 Tax=Lysobacter sp. H21R4 TaxID=2781021 RepID=UPI001887984D|nr:Hpt domain-containing protein [Lysobacter sp. H21R4]QOY62331.1 Hpt domain-containing protein [Lysobacter sp. H21R4]
MTVMRDAIDTTTLGWIKPELDETLRQAREQIEAFAESPADSEAMRICASHLHQVHGTLRMVELYAPAMVAEEMERLALGLLHGEIANRDVACTILMRGAVQLPDYLERLQSGHRDIPIVLLPLLNELRATRGESGLNESVLFAPNLDRPLPVDLPAPVIEDAPTIRTGVQPMSANLTGLREAMAQWPEGGEPADPARLAEVVDGLLAEVSVEPLRRMLWVASSVAGALRDGALPATRALRQAFGGVEREARQLLRDDFSVPGIEPNAEPTRQLLYHVAHSDGGHPALDSLRKTFELDSQLPSESELDHARGSLSGRNRALLDTVSAAIKEDLLRVKDALDLHLRTGQTGVEDLRPQVDALGRVSDTLGMMGLGVARGVVMQQRDAMHEIVAGNRDADESALLDVAGALLYVETSLDDQVARLGLSDERADKDLLESESRKVLEVVVREAIGNFGDARQSFVAFVETNWDHAELVEIPRLLDEVCGALRILDLNPPADYLYGVKRYIEVELIGRKRIPHGKQLDTLADALASVEYYLEALREQRPNRDRILEIARSSLEALSYWPVPEEQAEADQTASPVSEQDEEDAAAALDQWATAARRMDAPLWVEPAGNPSEEIDAPDAGLDAGDEPARSEPVPVSGLPVDSDGVETAEHVETVATPAAVPVDADGFETSDDIDDEIREVFLEELEEEIANLGTMLGQWQHAPENMEQLRGIRRVFHTLKGSGRLVGARTLGEFSWKVESMLNGVLGGTRLASPAVVALVQQAHAVLPQLHAALAGTGSVSADLAALEAVAERVAEGQEVFYSASAHEEQTTAQPDVSGADAGVPTVEDEPALELEGVPASVDAVLLEILNSEVTGHLETIQQWLGEAQQTPQPADDRLQRAIHTLNGAFAMTEVPVITDITTPAEAYVRRLLVAGEPASADGVAGIAAVCAAVEHTMAALQSSHPRIPAFAGVAEQLLALRDSLPEVRTQHPVDLDVPLPSVPTAGPSVVNLTPYVDTTDSAQADPDSETGLVGEVEDSAEAEELEAERLEAERIEAERVEAERIEAERLEAERVHAERIQAERVEAERLEAEQIEADRIEAERLDAERVEAERVEAERLELERLEAEREEAERIEAERLEAERIEAEQLEAERIEAEQIEAERIEAERLEAARIEAARIEAEQLEAERAEVERLEAERVEAERIEAERLEAERLEAERIEAERVEAEDAAEYARLEAQYEAERIAGEQGEGPEADADADADADSDAPAIAASAEAIVVAPSVAFATIEDPDEPLDLSDLDPELVDIFVEEGGDLLDHSDSLLAQLRESPGDDELLVGLQRDLHTLKGGARMCGIMEVGELGHVMESLLEAVVAQRSELGSDGVPLLERGFDRLHAMLTRVGDRRAIAMPTALIHEFEARASGQAVVAGVADVPAKPLASVVAQTSATAGAEGAEDAAATSDASDAAQPETTDVPETSASARVVDDIESVVPVAQVIHKTVDVGPLSAPIVEQHDDDDEIGIRAPKEQVRIRADLLDRLVNYAGEVAIYRARLEQQLGAFRGAIGEMAATNERMRDQLRRLEMETEAQIVARYQREGEDAEQAFDPLELDRFSNLQQLSRGLSESAADQSSLQVTLDDLTRQYETLLLQQSRVSSDLQEGLMRTRMVPFDGLLPRLRRVIRQASGELGKQVALKLDGAQGELDRNVLERMTAPLEHMLRNAIAHGVETPEQRRSAGKPEEGIVRIAIRREGSEVVLEVSDDGRGLDSAAIRRRGEERGLLAPDAVMSDFALHSLIFQPGFSTADSVSRLAGRGVGMDVVASEVRQLGGSLDIQSRPGQGTTFVLRLPQTLAVTQAVFVKIGETTFAVPIASVRGVGRIAREELVDDQGQPREANYRYGGDDYAVHDLGQLVGQAPAKAEGQLQVPVLLIRSGDLHAAVTVDQVIGNREIVVKPVGPQVASMPGIFGATIMGDGRVVVILDVAPLVRRAVSMPLAALVAPVAAVESRPVPLVMVVDDSVTMRKVTGRILERHNFEVATARDGLDALERMAEMVPDLMLLDIEMPRMDGYELATRMKADARLRDVPIVMITSRTGDKHRQRAMEIGVDRYLGKPYQEPELMRNVYELLALENRHEQ